MLQLFNEVEENTAFYIWLFAATQCLKADFIPLSKKSDVDVWTGEEEAA